MPVAILPVDSSVDYLSLLPTTHGQEQITRDSAHENALLNGRWMPQPPCAIRHHQVGRSSGRTWQSSPCGNLPTLSTRDKERCPLPAERRSQGPFVWGPLGTEGTEHELPVPALKGATMQQQQQQQQGDPHLISELCCSSSCSQPDYSRLTQMPGRKLAKAEPFRCLAWLSSHSSPKSFSSCLEEQACRT